MPIPEVVTFLSIRESPADEWDLFALMEIADDFYDWNEIRWLIDMIQSGGIVNE